MRKRAERAQIWLTFEEKEDLHEKASDDRKEVLNH